MRRGFIGLIQLSLIVTWTFALLVGPASGDYKQAVAYYMQGKYDKAIQELKPDLEQNPEWEFGHRLVGLSYLNLKNNALAISSLTRAVQLKSTAFSTYMGLGQAYFNMQKYDSCIQNLNQGEPFLAKEKESEKYKLYHFRGSAYFRLDKHSEAIADLTAAMRIQPTEWTDYSQMGIAYYNLRREDEAIQALQKAAALKPGQSIVAEYLGKAYLKKGIEALSAKQYPVAADHLRKAIEFNPKDGVAHYNLGEAFLFLKNYAEAEKSLNQALELLPKSPDVYVRLGLVYEKLKKWDQSLNAYQKASELNPSDGIKEAIARVMEAKKR
jgi:tetratricopeptide (TPR) repeat protein